MGNRWWYEFSGTCSNARMLKWTIWCFCRAIHNEFRATCAMKRTCFLPFFHIRKHFFFFFCLFHSIWLNHKISIIIYIFLLGLFGMENESQMDDSRFVCASTFHSTSSASFTREPFNIILIDNKIILDLMRNAFILWNLQLRQLREQHKKVPIHTY